MSTGRSYIFPIFVVISYLSAYVAEGASDVTLSNLTEDVEKFLLDDGVVTTRSVAVTRGCPADHDLPCVPKCCNIYDSYESGRECTASGDYFLPEFADCPNTTDYFKMMPLEKRYEYFIGDPCQKNKYILDVSQYPEDEHHLYSNGTLWYGYRLHTMEEYCVESVNGTPRVFVCFEIIKKSEYKFFIYPFGLMISIPLLIITASVYLGFEEFRDVQGKVLACHVICLAIAYFFLALVQLASQELNSDVCIAAAFIIQFFFISCFFWLNVLCFDTWRNIRTDPCLFRVGENKSERMRFICYCFYAFNAPCLLTIASLVMDLAPTIPESLLKPNFGVQSCWFQSDDAAVLYFYGPVGILILVNVVFFILSAKKIYSEQRKYQMKLKRGSSNTDISDTKMPGKIKIYIRALKRCISLFCVMGINWVAEVISWFIGGSELIWYCTDIFNTLQGVTIFYIFVIKPKEVRRKVAQKLRRCLQCCGSSSGERVPRKHDVQPEDAEEKLSLKSPKEIDFPYIDASNMSLDKL